MLLSSIIEEAMEDGMWVVVSNCDQDKNFWTLINFKLYQLKLEARVSPNYRLFIVMRQSSASIIPKYGCWVGDFRLISHFLASSSSTV